MASDLQTLGDEWSSRREKDEIINEFITPYVTESSRVAEIGVGGGIYCATYDFSISNIILYQAELPARWSAKCTSYTATTFQKKCSI